MAAAAGIPQSISTQGCVFIANMMLLAMSRAGVWGALVTLIPPTKVHLGTTHQMRNGLMKMAHPLPSPAEKYDNTKLNSP